MVKKSSIIKPKYRTQDNYTVGPASFEYNSGELVTVPDMAYSIPEILNRFTRGQGIPSYHQASWGEGVEDFENENIFQNPNFDITDVAEELDRIEIKQEIQKQRKQKTQPITQNKTGGDITGPELKEADTIKLATVGSDTK